MFIDQSTETKVKPVTEVKAEQKQEYKHIGTMRLVPGLTVWEFDSETVKLSVAKIERVVAVDKDGNQVSKNKIQYRPKCLYLQSLNRKNAERKLLKAYKIANDGQ